MRSKIDSFIEKLSRKQDLPRGEMESALNEILAGSLREEEVIRFLTLLRDKKETAEEVTGAINALRKKAVRVSCRTKDVIDTCGTGGDLKGTVNISTAAAFVVAGAGIPVAKHGNRAVSSRSGSADVLKACGVNIEASPELVARCVDEIGVGFLFAPLYHSTLKVVSEIRRKIATKTIFNILGPLLNPAGAKRQVIGVYERRLIPLVTQVLKEMGSVSAAVVYGDDGLDELTLTTTSEIGYLEEGRIKTEVFDPRDLGYPYCRLEELRGGDATENAKRLKKTLKGHSQAIDHCIHLNAALAIQVAGRGRDFREALLMAQEAISSGRAYEKLEALVEMTNT